MTGATLQAGTPNSDRLEAHIRETAKRYKASPDWFTRFIGEMTQLLGSRVSEFTVRARHDISPPAYAAEVLLLVEDCELGFNFTSASLQPGTVPGINLPAAVLGRNHQEYTAFSRIEAVDLARYSVGQQFATSAEHIIKACS